MTRRAEEIYQPPPEHVCRVDDGPIDLVSDSVTGERHVLHRHVHYYREFVVKFSLQQVMYEPDGTSHTISRVDSDDGEVHRHVFGLSCAEDELNRVHLVRIPPGGHNVVDAEFDRYLREMLDNWEARLRTWRVS